MMSQFQKLLVDRTAGILMQRDCAIELGQPFVLVKSELLNISGHTWVQLTAKEFMEVAGYDGLVQ